MLQRLTLEEKPDEYFSGITAYVVAIFLIFADLFPTFFFQFSLSHE